MLKFDSKLLYKGNFYINQNLSLSSTILHKVQTGHDELGYSLLADTCYVTLLLSASYTHLIPIIIISSYQST